MNPITYHNDIISSLDGTTERKALCLVIETHPPISKKCVRPTRCVV